MKFSLLVPLLILPLVGCAVIQEPPDEINEIYIQIEVPESPAPVIITETTDLTDVNQRLDALTDAVKNFEFVSKQTPALPVEVPTARCEAEISWFLETPIPFDLGESVAYRKELVKLKGLFYGCR